jgi:hypothetical protein
MAYDATKNFAKVTASTGYAAGATTVVLSSGDGAKLPQPSTDGEFNLVWWNNTDYGDPSDDPNKEIVRCTVRSTDTLTVTRAQEGTADSIKNIADKTYRLALAITAKVVDDITDNIPVKAAGTDLDTGTDDAKFATAKALADSDYEKNPMTAEGDIIYGGTSGAPTRLAKGDDDQVLTLASGVPSWADASGGGTFEKTVNAGESLTGATTPQPICLKKKLEDDVSKQIEQTQRYGNQYFNNTTDRFGQSFTIPSGMLKLTTVSPHLVGTANLTLVFEIFAESSGKPTGSALCSKSISFNEYEGGFVDFTFDNPLSVEEGEKYVLVGRASSYTSGSFNFEYKNSNVYAGGAMVSSSDSGSNWTVHSTNDHAFQVWGYSEADPIEYVAWRCDASDSDLYGMIGFTTTTASAGSPCTIVAGGILEGFTGLTPGEDYYVQDTAGTIGTSPGSETIRVGRAISTTELIILI